ncbi:serine hydrolase domain-containing protein [Brevundimonas sp. GCM10030266]|uniref:serine hydrolase domain-containing protein n=1 Tax=Brevundimonas sp. GCM10030266 TaxID=3273386 RepID=UPI00361573C5
MKSSHAFAAVLSLALLWAPALRAQTADAAHAADIDAFVRKAMARVEAVPGLAVAVVTGDEVVMTLGYGVADVRTGAPVDAETGFYIASATKSFTALAVAGMAARGEVSLDSPVSAWTGNPEAASGLVGSVSLTDLLSHRSGLDNNPIAFRAAYSGDHSPTVMQRLAAETVQRPDTPRGVFRYSNAGYNLATTLLEASRGRDWRVMVRDEVLASAGMTQTTAWISEAGRARILAVGHLGDGPTPRVSPLQKVDATMQSAGGLVSTAHDMARWLELQINDGLIDGRQVFPAGLIRFTHRPLVTQDTAFGAYHRDGYGLGWQVGRYGTDVLIHHFGNFSGSRAHVSFMPDRRLGVAVMVNEDLVAGALADVVANYVYDRFAERPDLDAVYEAELATLVERRDRRRAGLAAARAERAARPWSLSRPMTSYVGTYVNPAMGSLQIGQLDGRMTVAIGVLSAVAEAYTDAESVRVELVPFQGEVLSFQSPDTLVFEGETFLRAGIRLIP